MRILDACTQKSTPWIKVTEINPSTVSCFGKCKQNLNNRNGNVRGKSRFYRRLILICFFPSTSIEVGLGEKRRGDKTRPYNN